MALTTLKKEQNFMTTHWINSRPIAHRGYHYGDILENSKDAFLLALKYKLNIECDVRMTKDKQIVVFHDANLKRLFNLNVKLKDVTLSNLQSLTKNQIITLQELLELVKGQVNLIIEIKSDGVFQQITERVIKIMDNYPYQFALKSFNMFSLLRVQRLRPDFYIGKILQKDNSLKNIINQAIGFFVNEDFTSVSHHRPVKIKRSGPQLTWTITSLDDFQKVQCPIFEQIPEDELLTIYNPDLYELPDESDVS